MKKYPDKFWDIEKIKQGTILRDWFDENIRIIIMRGPASMNVYLGIPEDHPLAGFEYDDLPIDCHGGLTFSQKSDTNFWPKGYWWYGYDYAHLGDQVIFADKRANKFHDKYKSELLKENVWTIGEIVHDTTSPIYDLKKLVKISEKISKK